MNIACEASSLMSKFKKPTKKEIKRLSEILVHVFEKDQNREFENSLYLALNSKLHKKALVEQAFSLKFGFDPF
jgi:hypothetical protein